MNYRMLDCIPAGAGVGTARWRFERTMRFTISVVEIHRSCGREIVYSVPLNARMAWLMASFHGTAWGFEL